MTTIVEDKRPYTQVVAGAGATDIPFEWWVRSAADMRVLIDGVLNEDWTIADAHLQNSAGGNVVLDTPLVGGEVVTVLVKNVFNRLTQYTESGSFKASAINLELAFMLSCMQENRRDFERTMKLDEASEIDPDEFKYVGDVTDGAVLMFDGPDGNLIAGPTGNQITAAQGYANAASASATAAATSATAAATAKTNAETAETNAETAETNAETAQAAAEAARDTAITNANTATTQAGIATTQAGIATTQASNASTSASTATTQAGIATTQAGIATTQASSAASSASDAAALLDSFDDRYLGPKASDPTLDNDGNALLTGALYWNTVASEMRVYNGSSWTAAYLPAGSYVLKAGDSLTGALNFAQGADIASATTTDIGAATGNFVHVTGTTTITGLGTVQAGTIRVVRFAGALTLTHNATSLILPGSANITTAANDVAVFVSEGSGNWRCISYQPAGGVGNNIQIFTSSGTWNKPSGFDPDSPVLIEAWGGGASGSHSASGYNSGSGGGSYWSRWMKLSELAATETVTVGAGGTGVAYTQGSNGGNSSFGAFLTAYGGTAGTTGNSNVGGAGGSPLGQSARGTRTTVTASQTVFSTLGDGGTNGAAGVHGGLYNGGGGGSGSAGGSFAGGAAMNGGGGGAGGGAASNGTGGVSLNGGNGGKGQATIVAEADGAAPGGGGGGRYAGPDRPGHGGRGEVRVSVFRK